MSSLEVIVDNQQDDLRLDVNQVAPIVAYVLELEKQRADEVGVRFVSNQEMCAIHQQFFNDPSPTDCMSFPIDEEDDPFYRLLGDVIVCPKTAVDYCANSQGNVYVEVTLYLVHGLLHLLGYDDIQPEDAKVMREAEERHLAYLRAKGAILEEVCP